MSFPSRKKLQHKTENLRGAEIIVSETLFPLFCCRSFLEFVQHETLCLMLFLTAHNNFRDEEGEIKLFFFFSQTMTAGDFQAETK